MKVFPLGSKEGIMLDILQQLSLCDKLSVVPLYGISLDISATHGAIAMARLDMYNEMLQAHRYMAASEWATADEIMASKRLIVSGLNALVEVRGRRLRCSCGL